jgi:hypothetical protein
MHSWSILETIASLSTGGWCSDFRCLLGTRTCYLDRIWEWVRNPEEPALLWLSGVNGSGKSAISHEFAATLHEKRWPYSCFFFRQDDNVTAESAIRRLAYGLSSVNGLRELIVQAMELSLDIRIKRTEAELFSSLVVTPLRQFSFICSTPVVLVIDGVDKCPADIRQTFLSAISAGFHKLPSTAKVYLTSCPEVDMRNSLDALEPLKIPVTIGVGMDNGDIEKYLKHEFKRISEAASLEETWPTTERERDAISLAPKAGGLSMGVYPVIGAGKSDSTL